MMISREEESERRGDGCRRLAAIDPSSPEIKVIPVFSFYKSLDRRRRFSRDTRVSQSVEGGSESSSRNQLRNMDKSLLLLLVLLLLSFRVSVMDVVLLLFVLFGTIVPRGVCV